MANVFFHPTAKQEWLRIPARERAAPDHVRAKLELMGDRLPFPHQSNIRGSKGLRELRPRGGRSPWRAFYQRVGDNFVIAAVGPEAEVDSRGFGKAVAAAVERLQTLDGTKIK